MQRKFMMAKKGILPLVKKSSDDLYDIEFSMPTKHNFDEIWGALVKPEKLGIWLQPVSGKLAKGGEIHLGDMARGKIAVCEPKRRLALSFLRGAVEQNLDITFAEVGKGKAKSRHVSVKVGARISDLPAGVWQKTGPAVIAIGWEIACKSLLDYLDDPKSPPAAGAFSAFAMSAQGRSYLEGAWAAWRTAAVAGGFDDAEMAKDQPSLLTFYSGLHR